MRKLWSAVLLGLGLAGLTVGAAVAAGAPEHTITETDTNETPTPESTAGTDDPGAAISGVSVDGDAAEPPPTATVTQNPTTTSSSNAAPEQSAGTIYLTFDDGPHPTWTPAILNVLQEHGAQATFFVLGQQVAQYPALTAQIGAAGHSVANHSYNHPNLTLLGPDGIAQQLADTQNVIANTTGLTSTCLRPPYGAVNDTVHTVAGNFLLDVVMWNVDPRDWEQPPASTIANHVIANAHDGAIVLLHDGGGDRSQTVAAVNTIVTQLSAQGYTFAPLNCS